jgi:hypothetical protein
VRLQFYSWLPQCSIENGCDVDGQIFCPGLYYSLILGLIGRNNILDMKILLLCIILVLFVFLQCTRDLDFAATQSNYENLSDYMRRAKDLCDKNKYNDCLNYIEKAINKDPQDAKAYG